MANFIVYLLFLYRRTLQIFHLVVKETFGRCQLHPELCPHPKDCQNDANNGHKKRQLDLVTEYKTKSKYEIKIL